MASSFNSRSTTTWRPVELVAMVIGFVIFWPLGLAVIAWKLWNDRSANPTDIETAAADAVSKAREAFNRFAGGVGGDARRDDFEPTGNAAFDLDVRARLEALEAQRRKIADEVAAFRAFLNEEVANDADTLSRFRAKRGR